MCARFVVRAQSAQTLYLVRYSTTLHYGFHDMLHACLTGSLIARPSNG